MSDINERLRQLTGEQILLAFWGILSGLVAGILGAILSYLLFVILRGQFGQPYQVLIFFTVPSACYGGILVFKRYRSFRFAMVGSILLYLFVLVLFGRGFFLRLFDNPIQSLVIFFEGYLFQLLPLWITHCAVWQVTLPYLRVSFPEYFEDESKKDLHSFRFFQSKRPSVR